ncbi:MAG: aminotransferase class V-fold PLP-dependent enzyme, partial [Pseudomonadota bacterium]
IAAAAAGAGAIVISHVQFRSGRAYDLAALGAAARAAGALLIVDATQSLGAVPVRVAGGPHILMASGYKWLCAGYGVGAVYVSPELQGAPPPVYGWRSAAVPYALHPDRIEAAETAVVLEMGHPPFAPVFALGAALDHAATVGEAAIWARICALQSQLREGLAAAGLPAPTAPAGESGIAALPTSNGAEIKAKLAAEGILISASTGRVRLSTHAYNTAAEVARAVEALARHWRD